MIDLILAVPGRDGIRLAKQLIDHTSGLTVVAVTDFDPIPGEEVVESRECVVAIVSEDTAEPLTQYVLFRELYPNTPLVLVTGIDGPELIQRTLLMR